MSNQVIGGSYALHLQLCFLELVGILGIEQLEEAIGSDADQGALGRVGVPRSTSLYYAAIELVLSVLANGWPVCDIKLSLVRASQRHGVGLEEQLTCLCGGTNKGSQ